MIQLSTRGEWSPPVRSQIPITDSDHRRGVARGSTLLRLKGEGASAAGRIRRAQPGMLRSGLRLLGGGLWSGKRPERMQGARSRLLWLFAFSFDQPVSAGSENALEDELARGGRWSTCFAKERQSGEGWSIDVTHENAPG